MAELCCDVSGRCEPSQGAALVCGCIHCGKELHEGTEAGCWFTWDWASYDRPVCQVHGDCPPPETQ